MGVGDDDTRFDPTAAPPAAPTLAGAALADGTELVAGRYRIVRWLGGGGMGRVYEAIDTELDERIALKVLRPGLSDDAIERFRREVKLTRRIQHHNVARMFDIGEHAAEKFLTMELVDGAPLKIEVMPWLRLRAIAEQICAGLAAAHAAGVVHRDLKPDNIMIERGTDRAVITDFGIARGGDDPSVTQVGAVIGTPRYMAPEQLAGNAVDARADLFSLGVILFELATGARPWQGDNVIAIAVAQATSEPAVLDTSQTEIPPAFAEIVAACLQLEPARRPASASDVGAAIAAGTSERLSPQTRAMRSPTPGRPPGGMVAQVSAFEPSATKADTALAVLPVQSAPADAYLADGLREDMTDTLSTTPGLRVRPAGHIANVATADPRDIGKELGVDHVVVATVRRTPTGLRVAARLIGVADGFQIWAHKTDCSEAEILAVSERLAHGVAAALSTRATDATRPTDPRAVELYLRARAEMRRFWGGHVQIAADTLAKALEYAPTSPPILGAFAYASVQAWVMRSLPELADRAREAIDRAMPSGHGEAYLAAAAYWINQGEPERGATNLGIALVRAPMSAHAHELAGRVLVELIGPIAARQHFDTARGLDPGREQIITGDLARLEALEGNWASADERIHRMVSDPDPSLAQLGAVFQARLAAWRSDLPAVQRASAFIGPRISETANLISKFLNDATITRQISMETYHQVTTAFTNPDRPIRQQLIGLQLLAEIAVVIDHEAIALSTLRMAAELGLMDVVWLEGCPLFRRFGDTPEFAVTRKIVASRAQRVLAAFHATQS